jgi:parvulin-like peptidyl-prolyl isomerase
MRVFFRTVSILTLLLTVPAAGGDRVVARVGSEAVTLRELNSALEQNPELTREKALQLLIDRRLVLVWANGKNISVSDQEIEQAQNSIRGRNNMTQEQFENALLTSGETMESFRAGLKEQITINKALDMALAGRINVTDSELQDLYLETYPSRNVYEVSHILLTVEGGTDTDTESAVKERAEQVLAEIHGGTSFESAALKYSQDASSADKGGRLGSFQEGEMLPELENLAATLEPGETGGPVRTSAGYHILKMTSKGTSTPPSLAEVKGTLERNIMIQKQDSIRTEWLEELKETTYIEVFPENG